MGLIKKCSKCLIDKKLFNFAKSNNGKFGVRGSCKKCCGVIYKKWAQGIGKEKVKACNGRYYEKERFSDAYRFIRYKASAKQRGFDFKITKQDCFDLFSEDCSYCGSQPGIIRMGIDRIDSNFGYVLGNVVACCKRCNLMKNNMNLSEFIEHCEKIIKCYSLQPKQ